MKAAAAAMKAAADLRKHQQQTVAVWSLKCLRYADFCGGQTGLELSSRAVYDFQKLKSVLDTFLLAYYNNDILTKEEFFVHLHRREIESYYTDTSFFHVLHPQLDYLYMYSSDLTFDCDILKYMIFVYHYLTYIMRMWRPHH